MAAAQVETASVFSDTASDFSDSTAATTHTTASTRPAGHLFTCLACHVAFRTAENQRDHMRTDWHRYNLKRKVAELPPVTAENFAARVMQQQQAAAAESGKAEVDAAEMECTICRKSYSSENAYTNHIGSKKHKEMEAKSGAEDSKKKGSRNPAKSSNSSEATPTASSSSEPAPVKPNYRAELAAATTSAEIESIMVRKAADTPRLTELDCLFCPHAAQTFEANLEHMTKAHSFFIPDIEYLVDLKGLIAYLGEKVAVGHICLFCNGKGRAMHSIEAVRGHMLDKGHCKILYEDGAELEIADFYDFSSTYPEEVAEPTEGDKEWEDVPEDGDAGSDDESELGDLSNAAGAIHITEDETQLILPSGVRLGHRQFNTFWRQNLRPESTRDSVLITRLEGQYKVLGYQATPLAIAKQHHERRMQAKKALYAYQDFKARTGFKHNGLQKHFRSQIGFGV